MTSLAADDGLINGLGGVDASLQDFSSDPYLENISLPADDGLINGIGARLAGPTIELGEIKDTFDMGDLEEQEKRFKPRGGGPEWFKKGVGTVMIILFLLFLPVLLNVLYVPVEERISIDGNFEDWNAVRAYFDPPAPHDVGSIDIREYRLATADGYLFMYLNTADTLFAFGDRVSSMRFFIDVEEGYGYDIGDIRAEYLVEIYGWNGEMRGTSFHKFNRSRDMNDWNGFVHTGSVRVAYRDNRLEASVWVQELQDSNDPKIFIHTMSETRWDSSEGRVVPERDSIVASVEKVGPRIVAPQEIFPILQLDTFSLSGDATLESINIEYNEHSEEYIDEVAVFGGTLTSVDLTHDTPIYYLSDFNGSASLIINETLNESISQYVLAARVSPDAPSQSALGLHVTNLSAYDGIASIQRTRVENVYVNEISHEPRVDGAFAYWDEQQLWEDPFDDLSPIGAWNPNIDIRSYSVAGEANFLVSVEGNMLGGADVPYIRGRPPELVDSDGDGIPDIYDPFPSDFTNDGTPDSEMLTPEGLPDVDGDGVADRPYGPDQWLNTTIPVHPDIPEEYWGREVNRYIGPVTIPVRTGEDYVRIFIDADTNSSTGYTAPWLNIGAEYMIEITGRNMAVTGAEYLQHDGARTDWSWELLGEVPVALDSKNLETALDTRSLGIPEDFHVAFVATDWQNNLDTAVINNHYHGLTRGEMMGDSIMPQEEKGPSAKNQLLYLRDEDALLAEEGDDEMSVRLRRLGTTTHTWTSEPFAGDFSISTTTSVRLYLEPSGSGANNPGLNVTLREGGDTIGYGELGPITTSGWYSINMATSGSTIPASNTISLDTRITGSGGNLEMKIVYNSPERNSQLVMSTNTTVSVDDIYTLNEEGEKQEIFDPGEYVEVNAEVTHPIDASLITETTLSIYYPNGTAVIEDVGMDLKETDNDPPPYWSIFNHSFVLGEHAPGGIYDIVVSSVDNQGISSVSESSFIVPSHPGVIVYPDGTATVEPGAWADYEVYVQNIGNMIDEYELSVNKSSRKWPTVLSHGEEEVAVDEDGDGTWNWVNPEWDPEDTGKPRLSLVPLEKLPFTLSKLVDEDANGDLDTTLLYAESLNHSGVSDQAVFTTYTPYPSKTSSLYLHQEGYIMDTFIGESNSSDYIETGTGLTWTQDPSFARDFNMLDRATVHMYIIPTLWGWRKPDVTVTLLDSGTEISSFTISKIETEGWYEFPIVADTTVEEGNRLELSVSSSTSSFEMLYDSQEYPARVELNTDTYIRVEEIVTYKNDTENSEFWAGDTVDVYTRVSDPFGSHNIASVLMTIYDPEGEALVSDIPMNVMENGPFSDLAGTWFEGEYELSDEAIVGEYIVEVTGHDQQEIGDDDNTIFQIPADVEVDPDNEGEAQAGTEVFYDHTITNLGRGNDRFELSVSSSLGYNITLYDEHGNVIAVDIGGNGNWDYVDPAWDSTGSGSPDTGKLKMGESMNITVGVEIPGNAESGLEDVTTITAASWRDPAVSDSAADTSSIPEFTHMMLPVGFVFFLFFGWFVHRRFVLDGCRVSAKNTHKRKEEEMEQEEVIS